MANPLFNRFGGNNQNESSFIPGGNRMNNMIGMMQKFQQFKSMFGGDPEAARAQVQHLLDSGQMTQQQFEQLSQMANMFMGRR